MSEYRKAIDEPIPPWAIGTANGKRMQAGAVLPTRDGRICGNATVLEVVTDYGLQLAVCRTDCGNDMRLNESELEEMFYEPRWLRRVG